MPVLRLIVAISALPTYVKKQLTTNAPNYQLLTVQMLPT